MAKRRRKYFCHMFASERDAKIEAVTIRRIGHKATVKRAGTGFKVCTTFKHRIR